MDFLKHLAKTLVFPLMERRMQNKKIPRELKLTLKRILNKTTENIEMVAEEERLETRKLCHQNLCVICKNRFVCNVPEKFV